MWRWLDGVKMPEEQKKEAAAKKRKAEDTGDNENEDGGKVDHFKCLKSKGTLYLVRKENVVSSDLYFSD